MINVPGDHLVVPHNHRAEAIQARFFAQDEAAVDPDALPNDLRAILEGGHWEEFRAMIKDEGAPWNPPHLFSPKHSLPSNDALVSGEEYERLKRRLIKTLEDIRTMLSGAPPIVLLDFFDESDDRGCFTAVMLKRTLRAILGEEGYGRLVYDDLRANLRNATRPMVGNPDKYKASFDRAVSMPRVVISGGTFSDADDVHGRWFQEQIMTKLLEDRHVQSLMICWSYQVMARAAAKKFGFPLYVINGALRWGALPIDVIAPELAGAAFQARGRFQEVTAGFTHSDHLIIPGYTGFQHKIRKDPTGDEALGAEFQVVARDSVTRLPAAYTINQHVVGLAFHPEIRLQAPFGKEEKESDVPAIEDFMRRRMQSFLTKTYDVAPDPVIDNYHVGGAGSNRLKNNPGEPLYAGILLRLANQVKRELSRHG